MHFILTKYFMGSNLQTLKILLMQTKKMANKMKKRFRVLIIFKHMINRNFS